MASEITALCCICEGYTFLIDEQEQPFGRGGATAHEASTIIGGIKHVFAMDPGVFRNPALRQDALKSFVFLLENQ